MYSYCASIYSERCLQTSQRNLTGISPLLRNKTINLVARRRPHQTDNLLSWCILQCCCPALASDHRPHSLPHPSGSGRRPSSASAWKRPGEGRGYFWPAEGWESTNKHICSVMQLDRLKAFEMTESLRGRTSNTNTHNMGILLLQIDCASSNSRSHASD